MALILLLSIDGFQDMKQQDHIASLETTVENLMTVVTSVEHSIESMQRQVYTYIILTNVN